MNRLRRIGTDLIWRTGLAALVRKLLAGSGRFVLEFHGTPGRRYDHLPSQGQPGLTQAELGRVLSWVAERFTFLTPEEFLAGDGPGVLLTFDDGLANNYTRALPVLERFAAPSVFFVASQHVRNSRDWLPACRRQAALLQACTDAAEITGEFFDGLSESQLEACGGHPLITVGAHTVSHPYLTQCDDQQLERELMESRDYLSEISKQTVDLFAYPAGDYDRRVLEAVRRAGYRAAFAERSNGLGFPRYEIPRVGIYEPDVAYLSLKLSGLHQRPITFN